MPTESIPKAYKPYVILALAILIFSLFALTISAAAIFIYFADEPTPIWLTLIGVVSALGVALGFLVLFALLALAGWKSFREGRRVQVLPPSSET